MRLEIDVCLDYSVAGEADVLLQIEVAPMRDQRLVHDQLSVTSPEPLRPVPGEESVGQRTWVRAAGRLEARYRAVVEVDRPSVALGGLRAPPLRTLPGLVVPYLMPSRYVEADRFESFVGARFGDAEGGAKVEAMLEWMRREVRYRAGTSDATTTAADSFVQRQGVCRDFAHLFAAFARAAGIPARMVSGYAPGVTPPDFHALVEVWLSDAWHLVDATGMAEAGEVARVAVGRDATDIAFMTVFGAATLNDQRVCVVRRD